ncbi:ATP-grasp domain-containing protein [Halobacillus halophilus]|uniref:ATP-grasp domain-containing protein n=1 Tax=Halobacillus halophilus TaxID=1570 RepID=UPI001CD77BCA|nr:ATP-grasp domain-containing protein [Halobacillus halophilus]MCA1011488.1 ATP-grasp domain-containing protein [Halobacillus halophilus]
MQTIVFLGTNKSGSSREAIEAAMKMGYFTVLLTDNLKRLKQREEYPDVHLMIYVQDLTDKQLINRQIALIQKQGKEVRAVVSFVDPLVSTAAQVSMDLGLSSLSVEALYNMEDKTRFRKVLKGNPYNPFYSITSLEMDSNEIFNRYIKRSPTIVKSPISNGSKDVLLVKTLQEFEKAHRYMKKRFPNTPILLEEYLDGPQYLIEVVVHQGNVHIVAIIEQEISKVHRFIIMGYHLPAALPAPVCRELRLAVQSIADDLGFINGTCHLEMRLVNGKWKLIEINPRISGGAVNRLILEATGISLVKETLKLNLGQEPDLTPKKNASSFVQFITVRSPGKLVKVTGKLRAKSMSGVNKVYVKPKKGTILTPPLSMGHRYAYVLTSSEDPLEAKKIAKEAAKEIRFYLEPL